MADGGKSEATQESRGEKGLNERKKEIIYAVIAVSLPCLVMGHAAYLTYFSTREYCIEFKVFEANCWEVNHKTETQILTWGTGKYYFLGNWTGQFIEGSTYNVTFVQQRGSDLRGHKDLVVLDWREIG